MSYNTGRRGLRTVARVQMSITNSVGVIPVTGTGDDELIPPTGYVKVPFYDYPDGTPAYSRGYGLEIVDSGIQMKRRGWLNIRGYMDMRHSTSTVHVGVVFAITKDGVTTLTSRAVHAKMPNSSDFGHLAGMGITPVYLNRGDRVEVWIASDKTGQVNSFTSTIEAELEVR